MKRLSTMQLVPGMITGADILDMDGQLILSKGTELTDRLITKLDMYGILTVSITDNIPLPEAPEIISAPREPSYSARIRNSPAFRQFRQEYELNLTSFKQAINRVVEKNMPLDIEELLTQALNITALGQNPNSILSMLHNMREYDDSTYAHCINVALLCNIFATWLRFDKRQIQLATGCGLLHDVGKLHIPHHILTKPSHLTENEYSEIQKHPVIGYRLLKKAGGSIHIQIAAFSKSSCAA